MNILGIIDYATVIGPLSVLFTFFMLTIGKEMKSLDYRIDSDYEEDILVPEDEKMIDEDDERDFTQFPLNEVTKNWANALSNNTRNRVKCNEDKIMYYLAELQVINPETILQIASYNDLDRSCRKIENNLQSIDDFMATCEPLPQSHLYMQLIMGVRVLYGKLCVHSNYQLAFKEYVGCFQELHDEYIDCGGPADWTENMDYKELCTEYKAISDCYYTQTALLCGIKAAKTMKEMVVRVINAVIEVRCPEMRKNPKVENPMPEHAIYIREFSTCNKLFPCDDLHGLLLLLTMYITY